MRSPAPPPLVRTLRVLAFLLVGLALLDPSLPRSTPEPLEVLVMRGDGRVSDPATDPGLREILEELEAGPLPSRGPAFGRAPRAPGIRLRTEPHPGIRATILLGARLPDDPPAGTPWVLLPPPENAPPPLRVAPPGPLLPRTTLPLELHLLHTPPGTAASALPLRLEGSFPPTGDTLRWLPLARGRMAEETGGVGSGLRARLLLPALPRAFPPAPAPLPSGNVAMDGSSEEEAAHPPFRDSPWLGVVRVEDRVHAQLLLRPQPHPRHLLVLEPRPAWGSTFLRRALEGDPRITLHARTDLAPGIRTQVGDPPPSVATPGALDPFDLVVVAPSERLDPGERVALSRWVREGGGSLLLLPEGSRDGAEPGVGDPWAPLHGGGMLRERHWTEPSPLRLPEPEPGEAGGKGADRPPPLRARSTLSPAVLPEAGAPLLLTPEGDPVLWEVPRGAGLVVVSGALDAWEHRDPALSEWEGFWPDLLTRLAHRRPPALELAWEGEIPGSGGGVVPPGGWVTLVLTLRSGEGVPGGAPPPLAFSLQGPSHTEGGVSAERRRPIHPDLRHGPWPGVTSARFRAPEAEGLWWVEVEGAVAGPVEGVEAGTGEGERSGPGGSTLRAHLPLFVTRDAPPALGDPLPLVEAWARGGGGRVVSHAERASLPAEIVAAVAPDLAPERWHPMRSPLWILPLLLLLGLEWGWRRRRGLP